MGSNSTFGNVLEIATGSKFAPGVKGTVFDPAAMTKKTLKKLGPPEVAAPDVPDPVEMPDPLEQQRAKQRSLVEQLSRRGRSSTILTNQGGTKLGG